MALRLKICLLPYPPGHVPFALVVRGTSKEAQEADLVEMLKSVNSHVRAGSSFLLLLIVKIVAHVSPSNLSPPDVGPFAALGGLVCGRLPKTRSGYVLPCSPLLSFSIADGTRYLPSKTLRRTVRDLVENASVGKFDAPAAYPPTIEDVSAVEDARKHINDYFQREGKHEERIKAKL